MALLLLLSIPTPIQTSPPAVTFHAPHKISSVEENCASAGGTDGFYPIGPADAQHVFGSCSTDGSIKYTRDGGRSWELLTLGPQPNWSPLDLGAQWQWNLVPLPEDEAGGRRYHTWGGIDVHPTARTPRSYAGANATGVFSVSGDGKLQLEHVPRRVTIEGLPHDVNMTFPSGKGLPSFYGGPIRRADGVWLATIGLFWAGQPLSPSPDGPVLKMSVVALESHDSYAWRFLSIVANATNGKSSSVFGPDENDLALLADGKTVLCVIRSASE